MKIRFDTPARRRRAVAVLAAVALALPSLGMGTAHGASPARPSASGPGVDQLCISGSIINHDEQPLGEGWDITATPVDESGTPIGPSLTVESDGAGLFQFDNGTNGVQPGRWTVELDLTSVPGTWEPVTPAKFDVQVAYGNTACLSVRFKLRLLIAVDVIKIDDNHNVLEGWTIIATPGKGNPFALPQQAVTDPRGVASLLLTAGKWVLSEVAPPGVTYTAVMPPGDLEVELDAAAQQRYRFIFKNRIHVDGCIVVTKRYPGYLWRLPGWGVTVYRANGTVAAFGQTDQNGTVTFGALPLGPYTVVEEQRVGWKPAGPSHVAVTLSDDACQEVNFINEQDPPGYSIVGHKLDSNGLAGLPGWTISATPLDPTGYQPDAVVTDGTGRYQFIFPTDDYRVPGATYRVCEEMQTGWKPASPFCYEVTLPTKPDALVIARPFENRQVGHWESKHPACSKMHLIKAKNTWRSVARMYHKSVRTLMKANPDIKSRGSLKKYAGQSLCIP
jgi:hypothetical protein